MKNEKQGMINTQIKIMFRRNTMFVICYLSFVILALLLSSCAPSNNTKLETARVTRGDILASIPATGGVEPYNRLEIKPPVAGRVEEVLVNEGDTVKRGQVIAWMSSSDRAALLDAARAKGPSEVKYWEDVYKPTPVIAPVNGFIIVRNVEPGQTFTVSDAILVMADHLIVKAQVDETDLASIKLNQKADIILDAYASNVIPARVEHIAYESTVINNVTVYEVDVVPTFVPLFFRSGMSATVNFYQQEKRNILLIPSRAIKKVGTQAYAFVSRNGKIVAVPIKIGLENSSTEVVSGLSLDTEVIIPTAKIVSDTLNTDHGPRFNLFGGQRR